MEKLKNVKPRVLLILFLLPLATILALVPENTTQPFRLTAEELLQEVNEGLQFITPDQVAHLIINEDPSILLIDVRSADEYEYFHLQGAINIPLSDLLNKDWEPYLNQDVRTNIFYSNGVTKSNEAWMITRQLGYNNCMVLMGGLNAWAETIQNPEAPSSTHPDDEFARYDFRKGASKVFGGGTLEASSESSAPPKLPPIIPKPKRKKVQGGC